MPFKEDFTKGKWSSGLFDIDPMMCITTYCCAACTISEIHVLGGENNVCGIGMNKPVACLASYCIGGVQIYDYGQKLAKKGGFEESLPIAVLKIWCCGLCYVMQEYKQCTSSPKDAKTLITTIGKPSQAEMS